MLSVVTTELPPAVPAANTVPIAASPAIHVDGFQVQPPPAQAAAIKATVVRPKATTVHPGSGNASASDFASAGKKYLQTVFSTSTAKVGWSYLKAAVRGDGKQLKSLGSTGAVKQVGRNFENLGNSSQVKAVGNSFKSLGNAISGQYHRVVK